MDDAKSQIDKCIMDGSALRKFSEMIKWHGGDPNVTEPELMWEVLGIAKYLKPILVKKSGYIKHIDAMILGQISLKLGAGRINLGDDVKSRVGIELNKKIGDYVGVGDKLATIHSEEDDDLSILEEVYSAFQISQHEVIMTSKIINILG